MQHGIYSFTFFFVIFYNTLFYLCVLTGPYGQWADIRYVDNVSYMYFNLKMTNHVPRFKNYNYSFVF